MEAEVVSMESAQVTDGKVLPEGGEALTQGEVAGNMEMMVMDALDPTLLQMKTEVLEGGGTMTVSGGDEGQIITLQVYKEHGLNFLARLSMSGLLFLPSNDKVQSLFTGGEHGGASRCSIRSGSASARAGTCHNYNCRRAPGYLCWDVSG